MLLSTSTNLFAYRPDWVSFIPILDSMRMAKAAGFDAIDLNLCDVTRPYYLLARDDWRDWVGRLGEASKELSLPITQSHTPFYHQLDSGFAKREEYEAMVRRSIEASGMLGVPWIVMHAGTFPGDDSSFAESRRLNYEYFMPLLELAGRYGSGIAIENLYDEPVASRTRPNGVFTASFVELCGLVDGLGAANAGVCWDFGHAHLMGVDQPNALRYVGKRLKATHVADNSGYYDDHILPFQGKIDWRGILPVLSEIGYNGDLTYEIHNTTCRLPDQLLEPTGRLCAETGRYLLALAQGKAR